MVKQPAMKIWIVTLCTALIASCELKDKKPEPVTIESTLGQEGRTKPAVPEPAIDSTTNDREIIDTMFLQVDRKTYFVLFNEENEEFDALVSPSGDVIIAGHDYHYAPQVLDINEDGYNDLRVFVVSNTDNQCENYFYQKSTGTFKRIHGVELDITRISGTPYYFSYNAVGCSDDLWESHLARLDKDTLIKIGSMEGDGCESNIELHKTVKTYRINTAGKPVLVDKLFYVRVITPAIDKWTFIEKYWAKNYTRFL
jgi:hypothetical protein